MCFAGALLTKNEGSLFVLGAFLGLLVAAPGRWRQLAVAAAADVAVLLPWRIYVRSTTSTASVARIALRTLGSEMLDLGKWGVLLPLFLLAVVAALVVGLRALALYPIVFTLVSWVGLSWVYVISHFEYSSCLDSTKERVIALILLAGAALSRARERSRGSSSDSDQLELAVARKPGHADADEP